MRTIWRYGLTAVALLTLFATFAFGQSVVTGDLTGTVTDPQNAVVSGANVTLTNTGTNQSQTTTTNGQGQFRFSLLQPGTYDVKVDASGMSAAERRVTVSLGQVNTIPIKLGVAGATTTVEVTEQTPLLQTENANIATSYDTKQLASLPTPGGDITAYAYSAPGVVLNSGEGYGNFSSFGLPSTSNLFTVNGNDNMDPYLNLNNTGASNLGLGNNELAEEVVVNNGYTAQYGRQAGAQMNASTKSGTNAFHGNAIYWWNGRTMNANEWFANHTTPATPRAFANNNQYAASFGGPIVKNKLFFFADTEGLRYVLPGAGGNIYIPTPTFSNYVLANVNTTTPGSLPFYQNIFNLYAGAPGANRANTAGVIQNDPTALGCGDFTGTPIPGTGHHFGSLLDANGNPIPGTADTPCAQSFISTQNNLNTEWLLSTRVDWNISGKDKLAGRFRTDHGIQATGTDPINPIFNANSVQPEYEGQLTETHVFSGTTVNQLILSGMWYKALFSANNLPGALATFPTTMLFGDGLFQTLGGTDNNFPQGRIVSQAQLTDDFSKTVGKHDLKFGINFRDNWVSDYSTGPNTSGTLTINSMSEFVAGNAFNGNSTYSQAFARVGAVRIHLYNIGFYGQDQWKASSKLAVTLALRIDDTSNPTCSQNCFSRLAAPFQNLTHDPMVPLNAVIRTGLNNAFASTASWVVQPRLGMAYSITPNTVLRGGVGIFADLYPGTLVDRFINNAPNVGTFQGVVNGGEAFATGAANNVFGVAAGNAAAFNAGFASGAIGLPAPTFSVMNNKLYNPNYLEWNFELEQQINNNASIDLNYVGNHGFNVISVNPWLNAHCRASSGVCPFAGIIGTTAPDTRFTQINGINNDNYSNYNGLTASFKYRTGSSFQGSFNYTWSHALDACSNNCLLPFVSTSTLASIRYQTTPFLPGNAYGASDYDVRQLISANYVYTSKNNWSNGVARAILGNWTLAGTLFFHSGYPWTPVNSGVRSHDLANVTGLRNATPIAQFTGGPINGGNCSSPDIACVMPTQFATSGAPGAPGDPNVVQTSFGYPSRNTFRGAGYFDTDMSLMKNIKLTERFNLGVGANFFNILNHPNFDLPSNNVAVGTFGFIQDTIVPATTPYGAFAGVTLSGRIIQMQARLTF